MFTNCHRRDPSSAASLLWPASHPPHAPAGVWPSSRPLIQCSASTGSAVTGYLTATTGNWRVPERRVGQARGRAGNFEIIEYILRGQPGGVPGTWGHHFDDYLLHAPITDQHRNKIAHQAALIESALGSDPADVPSTAPARATGRRILLIASGGAADLRRVDPALLHPADRLVLNDVDPDALEDALTHLPPATRAQTAAAPGNVLRTAPHLAADHGPFDLVLAEGLFDYLEERSPEP
jgi:hypothetical protein